MAAPELRLNVTLDLVGFRAEIQKLVITAQQDFKPKLSVELSLDDVNFKQKLKDLEKIKPVITIRDSQLIAARTRIGTLNKSLATLRRATATPIAIKVKYVEEGKPPTGAISKSGTFRQRLTGLDTEPIKQLYAAAGKAGIVQFDAEIAKNKGKIITALNQAAESSVTGLLNGLKSKDSAVKTAAKSLGDTLIAALKLSLQIQSPSKKMEAIGEDAGDGFNKGLKESLNEAKNSAVTEMRELVAALKSEAAKIQNISVAPSSLRGTPRRGAGFRALPEGASQAGAGVEFSEMMRRFRGEIAALTTQPQKYEQLLNALPDRRITTDLADVASRRSRAAEMPSFMPIQRQLGPGELEKQITGDVARYLRSIRIPNPWVGPTGDFQKFIGNISKSTKQLGSQLLLPPSNAVKLLPPGSSPTFQQVAAARTQIAYQRSAVRSAAVLGGPSAPVGGGGGGGVPPGGGNVPPRPPSGGGGNVPGGGKTYTINFATNASKAAQAIQKVQDELTKVIKIGSPVDLTLDTSNLASGINKTFKELDKEINKAQRKLNKLQIGSPAFNRRAEQLGLSEGQRERGQNILEARKTKAQAQAFEGGSEIRLQKTLQALRLEASQIKPNTIEWVKLQQQIGAINFDLQKADKLAENIQLREQLGAFSPGSLALLETKLTILRNKAREIIPDTAEWKQLNKEIQTIEGSLAKANKKPLGGGQRLGAAGGAFLYGGGLGGGAGSAIGGIAGGLLGGVPGAFTGAALGQAADDLGRMTSAMVEQATVVKKLQLGLASASNSFGDFAAANKEVKRISDSLLIPLEDTYRKFTQLRASTVALGIDTKTTGEIFEGTAAAVLKSGGSMDDVSGAMRAVVQVFSKGKLTAEELRGQLAERLPGAVVEFAESAGMSVQQLDKEFEAGTTTLDDFVKFLRKKSKESADFTKEMAVGSEYAGRRMEKAFEKVQISIGQAFQPTGAAFQDFATGVISLLDKMIEKAIKFKLLQPGKDFYIAEAMASGEAGIAKLENKLLDAMQNQKQLGKNLDDAGIGFMKNIDMEYTEATKQLNIYQEALKDLRKEEKLTKQREEQGRQQLLDEKLTSGMLNAIEQREESLGKARENYEENIANIRENAVKQAQDLEKKYQDQRLQAERTLAKIRRDLVSAQQEAGFLDREANAALTGEDPGVIDAERKGAETVGIYTEEKIRIEEESQDRQIALSKELENFKRTNADAINQANERYTKNNGEIQRAYAKSVAKLIEEGSKNGAKQLVAAGKLINELTKQSIAQKAISSKVRGGVEPLGVDQYKVGEIIYSAKGILDEAKIAEQTNNPTFKGLYQLVLQLVQATNNIAQAEKVLASSLSAATSASPVITSTVNTRDLDTNVGKAQASLQKRSEQVDDANKKLNEQKNIFTKVSEIINGITDESDTNLRQINQTNRLTEERLALIRQGVLPALAEEEATLKRNNELQIDRVKAYFKSLEGKGIPEKNMEILERMLSNAINRINKVTARTKAAQQEARDNAATTERMQALKDEIQLLSTAGDAERRLLELKKEGLSPGKAREIYNLEKVKKNLEDTKALIGNFVSSASSDYKGFLKAVISGEDAVDALQKFQEGLTDKVLTIFLDFAMAPVEDMMKKSLEGLFMPKADTSKVQANVAVDANTTATTANTLAIEALTAAKGAGIVPGATPGAAPGQGGVPIEVIPFGSQSTLPTFDFSATDSIFGGLQDQIKASLDDAAFNLNTSVEPWKQTLITDIPFAFSSSNEQLTTQGATFSEGLTNVVGGIGAAAAGITGIFAGISQIGKGGTSNVLGGIGSILMGAGGAIGGFSKIFGFADGGIPPMNKPSLVGERGPELFVPHSMGTIVPAGPTAGIREAMANGNGQSNASPVLNMSFESSTINGVEYVSRDQLEAAMMETRRQASRDGAKRGMTMTLDRLQQSPSTRSRIGLG